MTAETQSDSNVKASDPLESLFRPSMFWTSNRCVPSGWTEHVPFAFWLVDVLRPRTIVELGVHNGMSYSAMCQAVKSLGLPARCFAVDTWKGDEQAGFYSEDVYRDFSAFHDQHYAAFSCLIRSTFQEALAHFDDGSIDLLHIDGFHAYEAVRGDFESWLPKVAANGIVLFHDTNVREGRFGVHRFWDEVRRDRPHFNFLHGHGLGVLGTGYDYPPALQRLFEAERDGSAASGIRRIFSLLGQNVRIWEDKKMLAEQDRRIAETIAERDARVADLTGQLAAHQQLVAERHQQIAERDARVADLTDQLAAHQQLVAERHQQIAERDARVADLTGQLAAHQQLVAERDRQIGEESCRLSAQERLVAEAEEKLVDLTDRLAAGERLLAEGSERLAELSARLAAQDAVAAVGHAEIARLNEALAARDHMIAALKHTVVAVRASTSWRLTAPLRGIKLAAAMLARAPRCCAAAARFRAGRAARFIYRHLPVSQRTRMRIKSVAFSRLGFLLKDTTAYQLWAAQRAIASDSVLIAPVVATVPEVAKGDATPPAARWRSAYLELSAFARRVQHERIHGFEPKEIPVLALSEHEATKRAGKLAFESVADPRVSIVIPVYGKFRLTVECLCSVAQARNAASFEIIIVDDGSDDRAIESLARIPGVKYVRNAVNLGFVKTCNHGIAEAVGEYVLVLNNDVQVAGQWLDRLVEAAESMPDVGAVGPKIVYPNGRLQEAGVVINRDATAQLVGVAENPDEPVYNYRREVDYCSGAALLFKKSLFEELGGFDEEFAPSYCEDVDLSLKIRKRGLKILYVPDAVVVHHLSATTNAMHKSYKGWMIVRNQQKLAERWQEAIDRMNDVRLIAFYLPQFHPIPENDAWWGKGFTEWRNVAKARPNFAGHEQPLLPADLGFYDLRLPEAMMAQASLARRYGIHGFCFYYYWFGGKRLLEAPIEHMLASGKPDFPFCLCWANENWTRRWDGRNADILMQQDHTEADDFAVIEDVARFMRHPSYIRIQGKPVFSVYQVGIFPDIAATAARWRQRCREIGIGEIFLARVDSLDAAIKNADPRSFGFDAAIEFPPHSAGTLVETPPLVNPSFRGHAYDYAELARTFMRRSMPAYPLFRGVVPRWDNTARRQDAAHVFIGSNPGAYQAWLQAAIEQTRAVHHGDARIVFINSWNEWAEGAHLEPDNLFGHSYLQATRDALDAGLLTKDGET
jgi:GT2 family glycosyltransferase